MLSLEDYEAMNETAYLLQSPINAKRLMSSIDELDSGKGQEFVLISPVPVYSLPGCNTA